MFKMKECLENRMKQSKRKLKKAGTASPNPKKHKASLPKDELMQRCNTVLILV